MNVEVFKLLPIHVKIEKGLIIHFLTPMIKNVLKSERSKNADGHETHLYNMLNLTVEHSVNRFS